MAYINFLTEDVFQMLSMRAQFFKSTMASLMTTVSYFCNHFLSMLEGCGGSVVEGSTWDQGVTGFSLTIGTIFVLCLVWLNRRNIPT